jgi:adenylate cyclase
VDNLGALSGWLTGHEQLLSALAAMVVIAGVVLSPLGHGLRAIFSRPRNAPGDLGHGPSLAVQPPPMVEDRPSIAVLPFTNMSDDREQEFLADGMTEDIITGLSLSRLLFVIARNSTFTYKGQAVNVRDVGRDLGVRTVLEGSVRRIGESLRVTAQLIDTRNGSHLWAQAFDRPVADIFKMQDEITAGIVAALTTHLTRAVTQEVTRARPESLDAWQLCQRANAHFIGGMDAASRRGAEALVRAAVKKDPNYGVAWALLGFTIAARWIVEPGTDAAEGRDEARAYIERAVRLAPDDPEVLGYQGGFLIFGGKPMEALPYVERAKQMNPNEVAYRTHLARALCYSGRPAEALPEIEAVLRLSPRDPLAPVILNDMSTIQFALGRYAEAETSARRALAGAPRHFYAWLGAGLSLAAQGRVEEAHQAVREALHIAPELNLESYEYVIRNLGFYEALLADTMKNLAIAWPPELK